MLYIMDRLTVSPFLHTLCHQFACSVLGKALAEKRPEFQEIYSKFCHLGRNNVVLFSKQALLFWFRIVLPRQNRNLACLFSLV